MCEKCKTRRRADGNSVKYLVRDQGPSSSIVGGFVGGLAVVLLGLFWLTVTVVDSLGLIFLALAALIVVPSITGLTVGHKSGLSKREIAVCIACGVLCAVIGVLVFGLVAAFTMDPLGPAN